MSFSSKFRKRNAALICLFACASITGCQKNSASSSAIPSDDVARKNPVEANPAAVSEGQKLYSSSDCAICHGKDGDGKGVLAKDINMNTRNWRDSKALATLTDGELFFILAKGKGRMPGYEKRQSPDQMWKMVDYIRSLGSK
jgi:mono/diheme cytochrome c family protein